MNKLIFILLLSCCVRPAISQDYESLAISEAPLLIASNSPLPLSHRDNPQEVNYISDNISCVRVMKHLDKVYISWNVCDDTTNSEFFITKTQDNQNYVVETVKNIPCSPGVPLLYSTIDSINVNRTSFYKIFKIREDGNIIHIATILLPVPNELIVKSKRNKKKNKRTIQPMTQTYGQAN